MSIAYLSEENNTLDKSRFLRYSCFRKESNRDFVWLDVFTKSTQQNINHIFNKMEGFSRIFNNADDDEVVQEHTRYHLYILHWLILLSAQGFLQKRRDELAMLLTKFVKLAS